VAQSIFDLKGKCAVVVGGSSGIGRAIAVGLAEAGADVVPSARRMSEVEVAAGEIRNLGRHSIACTSDVRDRASLQHLHDQVVAEFGKVDILVNSAGVTKKTPTLEVSEEEWETILDTNLNGTLRACQIFGRSMLERGHGRIINIASLASYVAFYEVAAYGASKAAVASLTRSLAVEWSARGVGVNAIAPGIFPTELNAKILNGTGRGQELQMRTPIQRFGQVNELVGAAVFLASDAAAYVHGQVLAVDGGFLASGVNQ
jgi:NAD(P)-dependent dehydrogenase (short-subunit alcohol dehydrogenase family)